MHILVIKTSSLGDIIHTLPALTDACQQNPQLQCDWLVEEAFAEIPTWHSAVRRIIPVALRRWRKQVWRTWYSGKWSQFVRSLREQRYDKVIDAQGLIKSAFLTCHARGCSCGLDRRSAREPLAAFAYQQRYAISKNLHAVTRIRQLFAAVLDYPQPDSPPDYGIAKHFQHKSVRPTIICLHGTSWLTKHWPEKYWVALAQRITAAGFAVRLPWGNPQEYARAEKIASVDPNISLIPKSNLHGIATALAQARAVVGVDTGLAHLAAALGIASVTLYGATQPARTGTYGPRQRHLQADFPCAPCLSRRCAYQGSSAVSPACYEDLSVERVWSALQAVV